MTAMHTLQTKLNLASELVIWKIEASIVILSYTFANCVHSLLSGLDL